MVGVLPPPPPGVVGAGNGLDTEIDVVVAATVDDCELAGAEGSPPPPPEHKPESSLVG